MLDDPRNDYFLGAERRARYGLKSNEQLKDPLTNAKAALDIRNTVKVLMLGPFISTVSTKTIFHRCRRSLQAGSLMHLFPRQSLHRIRQKGSPGQGSSQCPCIKRRCPGCSKQIRHQESSLLGILQMPKLFAMSGMAQDPSKTIKTCLKRHRTLLRAISYDEICSSPWLQPIISCHLQEYV